MLSKYTIEEVVILITGCCLSLLTIIQLNSVEPFTARHSDCFIRPNTASFLSVIIDEEDNCHFLDIFLIL